MTGFYKLSGGGNDFLALIEPPEQPSPESVRAWCARGLSVGADGLFTLIRDRGGVRMTHYNADGGRAELCVNGTRCAAQLAFHLGWADGSVVVHTDSGEIDATAAGPRDVALDLPAPTETPEEVEVRAGDQRVRGWRLRVGGPHYVVPWSSGIETAPVAELGPALRAHTAFGEAGANVHWVDYSTPDRFEIRSFERGVEGETLACGSGVLAAAAVGVRTGHAVMPVEAHTRGGFVMRVEGETEGDRVRSWSLVGDARLLARGELLPDASA